MKFIPAIDLKDNKCVRLRQGKEENLTIFNNNPVEQAKFFEHKGCERIHIVDLDGAFGRPNVNKETILNIRKNTNIPLEFGGGIRNEEDISFWINKGIDFLVIGSLAVKNKKLILDIAKKYIGKIYVALDILDQEIMIKGWVESAKLNIYHFLENYNTSMVRGFIFTDISRDGMLQGLDMNLINKLILKTNKKVVIGGGLANYSDLYNLKKITSPNLEGVIAGKAFYSGNIKVEKSLKICASNA